LDDKFNRQFIWLKNELFKLDLASQKLCRWHARRYPGMEYWC